MNQTYTPDNTRVSVAIVGVLAAIVVALALVIGLSDKPDVQAIGIVVDDLASGEPAAEMTTGDPTDSMTDSGETADQSGVFDPAQTIDPATGETVDPAGAAEDTTGAEGSVAATPIPTLPPTPTPEIAAAVPTDPTLVPEEQAEGSADGTASLAGAGDPTEPLIGQFFTRPDEDAGAVVTTNEVVLVLADDGTGTFSGRLDMMMPDDTHIVIDMSGPIEWDTLAEPQATGQLTGTYAFDSPIDADDISSAEADLSITALSSSSGAVCTPRCYGFSYPAPIGR